MSGSSLSEPSLVESTVVNVDADQTRAGLVLRVISFVPMFDFFIALGFRVEEIFPADSPRRATLVGFGTRVHLEEGDANPAVIRITSERPQEEMVAPDGTCIEFVPHTSPIEYPPLESSLCITSPTEGWHAGRAGMLYRDLVPGRQGNCVIASHIRIPSGGPVPDYVHFHEVGFQLIFCHRGWVEVLYEGQGEPFVLNAGDCVIQPPQIRHRVLRSSDEMYVVEVGYPAEHVTKADPRTSLPSPRLPENHQWSGQRFIRYRAEGATWNELGGVRSSDTGIEAATGGLADVRIIRGETGRTWSTDLTPAKRFRMIFVLDGSTTVRVGDASTSASTSTTIVVPVGECAEVTFLQESQLLVVDIETI